MLYFHYIVQPPAWLLTEWSWLKTQLFAFSEPLSSSLPTMALCFHRTLITASNKKWIFGNRAWFWYVQNSNSIRMLQLPVSTLSPLLAQMVALRPLHFQRALWWGKEHRTGAGDSASREVSSVLHLFWNLCWEAAPLASLLCLLPTCLPGLRPIPSPGVQVCGRLQSPHLVSHYALDILVWALGTWGWGTELSSPPSVKTLFEWPTPTPPQHLSGPYWAQMACEATAQY